MKFNGVEETLFIPLAARVLISKNYSNYFLDTKSLELGNLEQVKSINKKTNEYLTFASVARYYVFDKIINNFINKNKDVNIVSLGVALETMNYRIKDNNNNFYSISKSFYIRFLYFFKTCTFKLKRCRAYWFCNRVK